MAMLILSATAASMDMEVSVFFTFWGLNFLKKSKDYSKKSILQKMMEFIMPKNMNSLPLSDLNMLVYRYMGFGGRVNAVPMALPFTEWFLPWKESKKLVP